LSGSQIKPPALPEVPDFSSVSRLVIFMKQSLMERKDVLETLDFLKEHLHLDVLKSSGQAFGFGL